MDIHHKFKPIHGWREFFGEVGIIVLGVLIALGAEQVVERIHWHHEVEKGREALRRELADNFRAAKQRELLPHCISRRLHDVALILDQAQESHRLPPVGDIGLPGGSVFGLPSWSSLSASGVASHFPREELLGYGGILEGGQQLTNIMRAEQDDWTRLYTIIGPGRSISDSELGELRAALSEAGSRAMVLRFESVQLTQAIETLNVPFEEDFKRNWPKTYAALQKRAATSHLCQPLGKAPDHYGVLPGGHFLDVPTDQLG